MSSHCQALQGAQGSHVHPSSWMLSHLRRQLELSAPRHDADSTYSPHQGFILTPWAVITLVAPRIMRQKKKRKSVSSAEYKNPQLFWLLWLRNMLVVFLLLKAQIEIPYALSHLHNRNVRKIIKLFFYFHSPTSHLIFLFFWHDADLLFKAGAVMGNPLSHLFPAAQGRGVVSGDWLLGVLSFL